MADSSVPDLFEGPVPVREDWVLGQGFTRDPSYCRGLLPDERMWPFELDQLPMTSNDRIRIDRKVLFAIAQRAVGELSDGNPWPATQLHAAITFWGAPSELPR